MATKLYLETTDPTNSLLQPRIILGISISIIVHTVIYTVFFNAISYIFRGRILSNQINKRIMIGLAIIMLIGFIARHYRAKDAYNTFRDKTLTREFMNHGYVCWVFMT
jgi:hypothetical protein